MAYIWQHKKFPQFTYDSKELTSLIQEFAVHLGEVSGLFEGLSKHEQETLLIQITLSEALKTSAIEGEYFSHADVMSSIRRQLGLRDTLPKTKDKNAEAIAKLMLQVRSEYLTPLSKKLIKNWHALLMSNNSTIKAGAWRKGKEPMQIISGRYGNIQVHYEAPPAKNVPQLMEDFINWYQQFSDPSLGKIGEAMLKSALAHLYFETIHPFEDGNGRIGRALAEKILAEKMEVPLYISLSKTIEQNKSAYYEALKKGQKNLHVTEWLVYFFKVMVAAENDVKETCSFTVKKIKFLDRFKEQLNARQNKAIQKMLDAGINGFEGGMTAKKYMSINSSSKATTTRDLQELVALEVLQAKGSGRSVHYELNFL